MPALSVGEPVRAAAFVLGDEQRVPLRLTVTRGVLGMELYEPIELGPIDVTRLSVTPAQLEVSAGFERWRAAVSPPPRRTRTCSAP